METMWNHKIPLARDYSKPSDIRNRGKGSINAAKRNTVERKTDHFHESINVSISVDLVAVMAGYYNNHWEIIEQHNGKLNSNGLNTHLDYDKAASELTVCELCLF